MKLYSKYCVIFELRILNKGLRAVYPRPQVSTCPHCIIVPILELDAQNESVAFLGTGFFVNSSTQLLTANHVIREASSIGIVRWDEVEKIYKADVTKTSQDSDLALLNVPDYPSINPILLTPETQIPYTEQIYTFEYSESEKIGQNIKLSPATRLGNVVRVADHSRIFGADCTDMLELSFPIIKGASGAPILSCRSDRLLGIVLGNIEAKSIPIKRTTLLDEKNTFIEEIQYMLPVGVAIHVNHVREFLK